MSQPPEQIFRDKAGVAIDNAIRRTAERGFGYVQTALSPAIVQALRDEANQAKLRPIAADQQVIRARQPNQVIQGYDRFFAGLRSKSFPVARQLAAALVERLTGLDKEFPGLAEWKPNQAGYIRYAGPDSGISWHRESSNQALLSATISLAGVARVGYYETINDPDDYSGGNMRRLDSLAAVPGTVAFFRGRGFGNGEPVVHDVGSPIQSPRTILNLYMLPPASSRSGEIAAE